MRGDLYISVKPRTRNKWVLKKTGYPSDKVLFVGTRFECQTEKNRLNGERIQQKR